jgi:threonine aldolase
MRQAGILAAAGLHALDHHIERLALDHANAKRFAEGLAALGIAVNPAPETNMVMFEVDDAAGFARGLRERALRINAIAEGRFRAVTHLDVSAGDIDEALGRITEIVRERRTA